MSFKLTDNVRNFYGEADYTIEEGILNQKGKLVKRNDLSTKWKNQYYYVEGFLSMRIDGRQAKSFAKENGIKFN